MLIKLSKSSLYSFLFSFFLILGVHDSVQSQITVFNATSCPITVFIGQNDISTVVPCDLCPINPPTAINIPAGGSQDIFGQDVCGEDFGWIAWTIGFTGFGISPNPGLTACVPNNPGPACGLGATNAFWLSSGSGPVSVAIF